MKVNVKIFARLMPLHIDDNLEVCINRYVDIFKRVRDLVSGDMFLYSGVWYTVD